MSEEDDPGEFAPIIDRSSRLGDAAIASSVLMCGVKLIGLGAGPLPMGAFSEMLAGFGWGHELSLELSLVAVWLMSHVGALGVALASRTFVVEAA